MISQNKRKILRQLELKKRRDAEGLFVAEGRKTVGDLLRGGLPCTYLAAIPDRLAELAHLVPGVDVAEASPDELAEVSALQTRSEVIAIFRKPAVAVPSPDADTLILALDEVQDPGNLGTIIRTADWFGVRQVVCSNRCADAFGPKAVQATMGALCRVAVSYTDLGLWLRRNAEASDVPVFGTYLEGHNIYKSDLPQGGIVLMGNEGHGIDTRLSGFVSRKLYIPNFPANTPTSESLNVSTATAVVLSEFRRRSAL
ncbi:MAG: RNA methyltransferase [Bacteroidales bacterium]|nr:RNA methyltransferase [Bacteroidales bacterium]MDY4174684.1 RNA methyltransferase [Bacteroidales bacterium]